MERKTSVSSSMVRITGRAISFFFKDAPPARVPYPRFAARASRNPARRCNECHSRKARELYRRRFERPDGNLPLRDPRGFDVSIHSGRASNRGTTEWHTEADPFSPKRFDAQKADRASPKAGLGHRQLPRLQQPFAHGGELPNADNAYKRNVNSALIVPEGVVRR